MGAEYNTLLRLDCPLDDIEVQLMSLSTYSTLQSCRLLVLNVNHFDVMCEISICVLVLEVLGQCERGRDGEHVQQQLTVLWNQCQQLAQG